MDSTITFTVNGQARTVTTDPQRPLLDVLREDLKLTGTKYGCGEGQCRACTVLLNGKSVASCVTPVGDADKQDLLTIEGLAQGSQLHPVQEAFLAEGAFQCGYCTSGMIMGTRRLAQRESEPDRGRHQDPHAEASVPLLRLPEAHTDDSPRRNSSGKRASTNTEPSTFHSRTARGRANHGACRATTSGSSGGPSCSSWAPGCSWPSAPLRPWLNGAAAAAAAGARNIAARVHIGQRRHHHRHDRQSGSRPGRAGRIEPGGRGRTARARQPHPARHGRHRAWCPTTALPPAAAARPGRFPPSARAPPPRAKLLIDFAAQRWSVDRSAVQVQDGKAIRASSSATLTYADLAADDGGRQGP